MTTFLIGAWVTGVGFIIGGFSFAKGNDSGVEFARNTLLAGLILSACGLVLWWRSSW